MNESLPLGLKGNIGAKSKSNWDKTAIFEMNFVGDATIGELNTSKV